MCCDTCVRAIFKAWKSWQGVNNEIAPFLAHKSVLEYKSDEMPKARGKKLEKG